MGSVWLSASPSWKLFLELARAYWCYNSSSTTLIRIHCLTLKCCTFFFNSVKSKGGKSLGLREFFYIYNCLGNLVPNRQVRQVIAKLDLVGTPLNTLASYLVCCRLGWELMSQGWEDRRNWLLFCLLSFRASFALIVKTIRCSQWTGLLPSLQAIPVIKRHCWLEVLVFLKKLRECSQW